MSGDHLCFPKLPSHHLLQLWHTHTNRHKHSQHTYAYSALAQHCLFTDIPSPPLLHAQTFTHTQGMWEWKGSGMYSCVSQREIRLFNKWWSWGGKLCVCECVRWIVRGGLLVTQWLLSIQHAFLEPWRYINNTIFWMFKYYTYYLMTDEEISELSLNL